MTLEEILQEDIRRYPIGTEYKECRHSGVHVTKYTPKWYEKSLLQIMGKDGGGLIYWGGEWAEIISVPEQLDVTEFNYLTNN